MTSLCSVLMKADALTCRVSKAISQALQVTWPEGRWITVVSQVHHGTCPTDEDVPRQSHSLTVTSLTLSIPFHVVKEQKSWTEAQQYCREEFTDLATIDNMTEMEKVKSMIHEAGAGDAWIGLKRGEWQWSLAGRDFYRENEAEFRNWDSGYPRGGQENCLMNANGKWSDDWSTNIWTFICYDGGNSTHPYVLVTEGKNWEDAQIYCREKHTDLASVRNQAENDQIKDIIGGTAWIGLFRDAWSEWSDGSSSSFRHWNTGESNNPGVGCTQFTPSGQWNDVGCHNPSHFICYGDPKEVKSQIVRVKLQVASHVNINDPAMQQAFLQQIQQRLRESGMPAGAKLTWMRHPDGQIFKEKKETKEEGRKRRKRTEL
ncbi:C-type mannose receptor 2-like [Alosa alosa]|uniref:C-type mannose receptor 2-like n=1 Tax=Alosa alosa TaxID=278164 RepID=UPI0020152DBC|nr:C-type mannose receptor 2-like [Alosa alosa]